MIISYQGTEITVLDETKRLTILGILFKPEKPVATVSVPTVQVEKRAYRKKHKKHRWTTAEEDQLRAWKLDGKNDAYVARQMKLSNLAIHQKWGKIKDRPVKTPVLDRVAEVNAEKETFGVEEEFNI